MGSGSRAVAEAKIGTPQSNASVGWNLMMIRSSRLTPSFATAFNVTTRSAACGVFLFRDFHKNPQSIVEETDKITSALERKLLLAGFLEVGVLKSTVPSEVQSFGCKMDLQ
ncbi:hypothetical protein CMV_012025 [Castanea mollissima]|uniref:Uncharacterized protein n=1 Tax=Castanea mollissima TaxID=60419 RepID=A0A8J4R251_9ROSI|nr:hypothetical protein CMV_012025 [Castanea mollissima]